ncbi:hypothetical protein ACQCVP_08325 [Rossellomorea vietnamensis]
MFCTPVKDGIVNDFLHEFGERPFGLQFEYGQQNQSILLQGGMYEITKE